MQGFIEQITKEFFFTLLAVLSGLLSFKYQNMFWRLAFYQLLAYILIVLLAYYLTIYQEIYGLNQNNQWLYNFSMLVETGFLYKMATLVLKNKNMITLFFSFFLLIYTVSLCVIGIEYYANYAYVTAGIFVTVVYSLILYNSFNSGKGTDTAKIYLSLGLLIYFACIIPYFSFINYLNKTHLNLSAVLFNIIANVLANIRYIFLAIGFWLMRRNALNSVTAAHEQ